MPNEAESIKFTDPIAQCIWSYKEESETARRNRSVRNAENFDCYHLKQDYSHKQKGQSKEFLPKQTIATEQLTCFLQQGLMDFGPWFRVEADSGVKAEELKIKPEEVQKLTLRQLDKNNFANYYNDSLKLGLLGSLMIKKVTGQMVMKSDYEVKTEESEESSLGGKQRFSLVRKDKKIWQLKCSLVRQEDYFPDPTGNGLYEIERMQMDWHDLYKMAKDNPGLFDLEAIERISPSVDELQKTKKSRETNQVATYSGYRKIVTLYQCWGTILEQGTGKILHENCVTTIDSQGNVIEKPRKNDFWHGESPYVVSPILRVPLSVFHKAVMDSPTRHNICLNELYNLTVDGAMMDVHGIKQIHTDWLEDPSQVSDGIPPATTLQVNSKCPPGMKALERVDTSSLTPEALNVYNLIDREYQQSAFTNDTRLGNVPQRAVKATEIVASNQSLTGVMNGIVKQIETSDVKPFLRKCWLVMAQHMNDLDSKEVAALLGEDRARFISSLSPEQIYAYTAAGMSYIVFGLSETLNKIQDFRKITALLQSIGTSPEMLAEFKKQYSMPKLLGEIMRSLDVDKEKIKASEDEMQQAEAERQLQMKLQVMKAAGGGGPEKGTNPQSQIPQAGSSSEETGMSVQRGANNIGMTHP